MHNDPPAAAVRIDPGAAAASLRASTGVPLGADAVFAVYRLGRSRFHAAVVRRIGEAHIVVAERTEPIGGAEFDGLLLAYLSGRHPDAGVRLWSRIADPAEAADRQLRALLLEKIAGAREQLSERDFTVITLPAADIKMPLTREEFESRVGELVAATVDVMEEVLTAAGVHPAELAGLLMAGGAARTPLAAATLRGRFGVEPVLAAPDARVLVSEAPPVATRELPVLDVGDEPPRRRGSVRAAVVGAALLILVAAGTAFASRFAGDDAGDRALPDASAPATTASAPSPTADSTSASPSSSPSESPSASPTPATDTTGPEPEQGEASDDEERPTTESAPTGTVPDLLGLSTAEARQAVEEAGFAGVEQSGEERGVFDWSHDDCEIIGQAPEPGATRALAEPVQVTFSYTGDESECNV